MIHHVTLRVLATNSGTGVLAFVLQAGFVARALRIENAFRTTGLVRIADVFGQTSAFTVVAYGVRAARRLSTRIKGRWHRNCNKENIGGKVTFTS